MVGEPFQVTCFVKNNHGVDTDSSRPMLEFCIQHPHAAIESADDYVYSVNSTSIQLVYTIHQPTQGVSRTRVFCFLKNSSVKCDRRNSKKRCDIVVGCE